MEEETELSATAYSKKRKALLEFKDLLMGAAFPFMLALIISASVISFSGTYNNQTGEGLDVSLLATVGGELFFGAAIIIFGRANGAAAYRKTVENMQKRELGSNDERVTYRTGEYALWKGAVIALMICIPFVIFQVIELCADNNFCNFCLEYICGWAYAPFRYLGKSYQALNFLMIIYPVGLHMLGYYLGKLKQIKIQRKLEESNVKKKGRKK